MHKKYLEWKCEYFQFHDHEANTVSWCKVIWLKAASETNLWSDLFLQQHIYFMMSTYSNVGLFLTFFLEQEFDEKGDNKLSKYTVKAS